MAKKMNYDRPIHKLYRNADKSNREESKQQFTGGGRLDDVDLKIMQGESKEAVEKFKVARDKRALFEESRGDRELRAIYNKIYKIDKEEVLEKKRAFDRRRSELAEENRRYDLVLALIRYMKDEEGREGAVKALQEHYDKYFSYPSDITEEQKHDFCVRQVDYLFKELHKPAEYTPNELDWKKLFDESSNLSEKKKMKGKWMKSYGFNGLASCFWCNGHLADFEYEGSYETVYACKECRNKLPDRLGKDDFPKSSASSTLNRPRYTQHPANRKKWDP